MSSVSQTIPGLPEQITEGLRAAATALNETRLPRIARKTSHVIFCGMGGSAIPGLVVSELFRKDANLRHAHLHTVVHRNYGLPNEALHRPAVVFIASYSGNTEETLSAYDEARRRRLPVFVIASGGALAERAENDRVPLARIPSGIPPRLAIPMQLAALLTFLAAAGMAPTHYAEDVRKLAKTLRPAPSAGTLAKRLYARIPILYASEANASLAYIFKILINENAKVPAFTNVFPELNHNEFNAYAMLSKSQRAFHQRLAVLFLDDAADIRAVRNRMDVTARFIRKSGVPVIRIRLHGQTALAKTLNAIQFGQQLGTRLAESYGVNPFPVDLIEQFKKALKNA